jgi:hypothetical protein
MREGEHAPAYDQAGPDGEIDGADGATTPGEADLAAAASGTPPPAAGTPPTADAPPAETPPAAS